LHRIRTKMGLVNVEINTSDAEEVLKRVFENKKEITKILMKERVQIDNQLLYDQFKPLCLAIVQEPVTDHNPQPVQPDEDLDLDAFEEVFNQLDDLDAKLTDLSSQRAMPKPMKANPKLPRMNSTNVLNHTGMPLNRTFSNPNVNATFCVPALDVTMIGAGVTPLEADNAKRITDDMLKQFNNMKIATFEELQQNRLGPRTRDILTKFNEHVDKLNLFCEKIRNAAKRLENNNSTEQELGGLNAGLLSSLKSLADVVKHMRFMDEKKNMFEIDAADVPTTDELTEILQKFSCGIKFN